MGRCAALYPLYICEKTMRARVGQQNTCVLLCSHGCPPEKKYWCICDKHLESEGLVSNNMI